SPKSIEYKLNSKEKRKKKLIDKADKEKTRYRCLIELIPIDYFEGVLVDRRGHSFRMVGTSAPDHPIIRPGSSDPLLLMVRPCVLYQRFISIECTVHLV
ncbi:MAG: hypothetical protein RSE63_01545, partial [Bacteroides sp.]